MILVTGANGFIGRNLCATLKARGEKIRALLRNQASGPWDDAVIHELGTGPVPAQTMRGISTVFHAAGRAHILKPPADDAQRHWTVNALATERLIEAAVNAGVSRFIFFSTVGVINERCGSLMSEATPAQPQTPYGQSKLAAESAVLASSIAHVCVLRAPMVYGAGAPGNLARMIRAVAARRFPPLPELGNQRSVIHVDDLVRAALLVAGKPQAAGHIFIVCEQQAYSSRQIYVWIREALGRKAPRITVPFTALQLAARAGDGLGQWTRLRFPFDSSTLVKLTGPARCTAAKIEQQLGFSAQRCLPQEIPSLVAEFCKPKHLNSQS